MKTSKTVFNRWTKQEKSNV